MELVLYPLLFFGSFGALVILLMSATAAALWILRSFLGAMLDLPLALLEYKKRRLERDALRSDLNRLKRAGV